jgi:MFS family permease
MDAAARTSAEEPFRSRISRALRYRNYRLFFAGQGISLIGTWLQQIALSWLVYRLTHSALWLGMVGFATQIPSFLLSPIAGVLVDRWNRHRVLVLTQTLAMVQAGILGALVLAGHIAIWHVLVLGAFVGVVNAFDMPTRQAFVVELIEDRQDLPNAIALNSSMVNGARLVGPAVAGVLLASVGEGWCFLLNSASYIAVILALLSMRVPPRATERHRQHVMAGLREGAAYVFRSEPIRALILLLGLVSLVAMPYSILMPAYATQVLHGNERTLGALMAASGMGALAGALYLAARRSILGLGRVIVGEQYHPADDCGGGQARAGDEPVHDGVHGHGAVRQPDGGRALQPHRRRDHPDARRRLRGGRRSGLRPPAPAAAGAGAADLCPGRHHSGDHGRGPDSDGADPAAGGDLRRWAGPHPPAPSPKNWARG